MLCTIDGAFFPKEASRIRSTSPISTALFKVELTTAKEVSMMTDLYFLDEWIPEQMEPGTMFLLDNATGLGQPENPYCAVLSCPTCGTLGLITRQQCAGLDPMICGSNTCSAE